MQEIELSIIVPVYNEQETVIKLLQQVDTVISGSKVNAEVIVVDDGSSDGSKQTLKETKFQQKDNFQFIFQDKNRGKGAAVRAGLEFAEGGYVVIQDADLEYAPTDLLELYHHAKSKNLDAVYGSRNLKKNNNKGPFFFYLGGKLITTVSNILFGQSLTDEPTCYKLVKRKLIDQIELNSTGFEFCAELTAKLSQKGVKIEELPISYTPRSKAEGKKIGWSDGLKAIWYFFKIKFATCNKWLLGVYVFLFFLSLYGLTWHKHFYAYEQETAQVALDLLQGDYNIQRAGLGAVLLYLPASVFFELFGLSDITYLSFVPVFYSALSVMIIFFLVYYLAKNKYLSLVTVVAVGLGSVVWPYAIIGVEYATTFYLLLLLLTLILWRKNKASLWLVGVIFGLLAIARSYGPVFGLPVVVYVAIVLNTERGLFNRQNISKFTELLLPSALIFFSALGLKYISLGTLSGSYSVAHEFQIETWWTGIYGSLFSFGKGIFFYSPLLIFVPFSFSKFYRKYKASSWFILSSFLLLFLINSPFKFWSDETWSSRKLVPVVVLSHLLLVPWFKHILTQQKSDFVIWCKKVVTILCLVVAVYVQVLGISYNLGNQLAVLRKNNLDSLEKMRYIPQFSHLSINSEMFLSYLGISNGKIEYKENSWFRWTLGKQDVIFHDKQLNLKPYSQPDILWIQSDRNITKAYFYVLLLLLMYSGFVLFCSYKYE